jgi:hypothetical protein
MMDSMKTPRTRAEFERNFNMLHQQITDGRYHIPSDYPLDSLARVRFLPNGRIDFLSVDEMARLQANTTAQFDDKWFEEHLRDQGPAEQKRDADDSDSVKA